MINIGNKIFEVLNPPRFIRDENVISEIKNVINEFENLGDDLEELKEIYGFVGKCSLVYKDIIEDGKKIPEYKKCKDFYKNLENVLKKLIEKINEDKTLKRKIRKMDNKFRCITNHLSLAFCCDEKLLFMGDLEEKEINRVAKKLKNLHKTKFYVLITPHHGTHWGNGLRNIEWYCAISSDNNKKDYKKEFDEFSKYSSYHTSVDRNIIISITQHFILSISMEKKTLSILIL